MWSTATTCASGIPVATTAHIPTTDADHSPPTDPDGTDEMLAPVSGALFRAVSLGPGQTVLDIGCGSGATTFAAASAVEPGGSVHGVDITTAMLDIARARLAASGLSNVSLAEGDVQADPLPRDVDVAISRFGTMFFDDPVIAFTNIREALRPGGRLCIATLAATRRERMARDPRRSAARMDHPP